jgi:Raf kinase inhibitor-like YbhB/YbcL family protein
MKALQFAAAFVGTLATASAAAALTLTSPDIRQGAKIADEQVYDGTGCIGRNVSPELHWSGAPKATKSFALTVLDLDAPGGGFWHWVVFGMPATTDGLAKGAGDPRTPTLPAGAMEARNDFGQSGYGGPCPPRGETHRYQATIHALDTDRIGADAGASAAVVASSLRTHTLAKASITARFGH